MRIAIVSDFYLDYVGGAQSSIHEQRAALLEAGHGVFLISNVRPRRGRPESQLESQLGPEHGPDLEIRPSYTVPGVDLPIVGASKKLIATLCDYLRDNRIDIVHLQTEFGLAHAATTAAHEVGLPVVHTVHTFYWQSAGFLPTLVSPMLKVGLENVTGVRFPRRHYVSRPSDNLLRNLTMAMAQRADVVVSPSAHQAADLATAGLMPPIVVVPNPIARSPRPAQLLSADLAARRRLLWVARCEPEKRPLVFAEAVINALERTGNGFEVDFVGDGSELAQLRKLVAGHPQIRVHGELGHDAVIDLIDSSAMVVLTSVGFDNQPMTIAEAASRYRGVLYCDPLLAEGLANSGHLSATPDVHGISDAIVELVSDPARLRSLSLGAQKDSATFSAATYVQRITSVYEEAAERITSSAD